jgi:deoxyadenosine/deoxycytidine kinase
LGELIIEIFYTYLLKRKMVTVYFIEGNISSAKSTNIRALKSLGYTVYEEPLDVWEKEYVDEDGKNILTLFYEDMEKWSFKMEVIVMMTRYERIKKALDDQMINPAPGNVIFIERSLFTDRYCFALNLYKKRIISKLDWKIYIDWHRIFMKAVEDMFTSHTIHYIYIRTDPNVCFERKQKRARSSESNVMPDYFVELHTCHEEWLLNMKEYPVHLINGNGSREEVLQQLTGILGNKQLIHKFVEMTEN